MEFTEFEVRVKTNDLLKSLKFRQSLYGTKFLKDLIPATISDSLKHGDFMLAYFDIGKKRISPDASYSKLKDCVAMRRVERGIRYAIRETYKIASDEFATILGIHDRPTIVEFVSASAETIALSIEKDRQKKS